MDLILWRHADAESGIPDAGRKLTAKGLKQAQRMAAWLEKRLPEDTLILVSPARRALETARALRDSFEVLDDIGTGAPPQAVLKAAGWPRAARAVLVVGHQPTLGQAAALAVTGSIEEWSVKKGAIWWLEHRSRDGGTMVRAVMPPDLL